MLPDTPFNYVRPLWQPPLFNRNHVAARGCRYAGVAVGGTFVNLIDGKFATLNGTPTRGINSEIGETGFTIVGTDSFTTAGVFPAVTKTLLTLGGIFVATSSGSDPGVCTVGTTPCLTVYINFSAGGSRPYTWNGTAATDSTLPAVSLNVPYFVCVSQSQPLALANWVLRNMRSGKIFTASTATAGPGGDTNGSVSTGNGVNFGNAAFFASNAFMSLSQLVEIAMDPWGIFYPPDMDAYDTLVGAAAAPAGASGRRLLLLGAG